MKILLLGGTRFIGRHVVGELLRGNHGVTLLNRGITAPGVFPELTQIRVDRETDRLEDFPELKQDWDAVIDLSAYFPRTLDRLLTLLQGRIGRYILCSSVSAYQASEMEVPTPILDESAPLRPCTESEAVDPAMRTYGQRKAECERVAARHGVRGLPVVILRPSVVFGLHDPTDRLAYWIHRAAGDAPFILPEGGLTITRRTYAPDLARAFASALNLDEKASGAYNIAETDPLSFRDTVIALGEHLGTCPMDRAVSVSAEALLREKVEPWTDFPLWLPSLNFLLDTFKARQNLGFSSTPARQALAAAADAFLREGRAPLSGIPMAREQELLRRLRPG